MNKSKFEPVSNEEIIEDKIYKVDTSIFVVDLLEGRYSLYKTLKGNYFVTRNKDQEGKILADTLSLLFNPFDFNFDKPIFSNTINPLSKQEVINLLNKTNNKEILLKEFTDIEHA